MRAMVLHRPASIESAPLQSVDMPTPSAGPGQVLIKVQACGICHTDLHMIEGELSLPRLPLVPGHQIVGIVEDAGNGVMGLQPGDIAGMAWLHQACGRCSYCHEGRENLCPQARFTGYHVDGGYAEYAIAPVEFVYQVPSGFTAMQAAPLLCGGAIGYRSLRLSGAIPGSVLGLYGFGASAHIVIQVARHQGCQVQVYTRSAEHQELARELGAIWAGKAQDEAPNPLDSAIIFAPAGWLVPLALKALNPGGTLALAGITMSDIPEMPYELLYHERQVRSVANATRQDARELLELAAQVPIRTQAQAFPLSEANRALRLLKEGRINGAGVLAVS